MTFDISFHINNARKLPWRIMEIENTTIHTPTTSWPHLNLINISILSSLYIYNQICALFQMKNNKPPKWETYDYKELSQKKMTQLVKSNQRVVAKTTQNTTNHLVFVLFAWVKSLFNFLLLVHIEEQEPLLLLMMVLIQVLMFLHCLHLVTLHLPFLLVLLLCIVFVLIAMGKEADLYLSFCLVLNMKS